MSRGPYARSLEARLKKNRTVSTTDFWNGTACIYWKGGHDNHGYPMVWTGKRMMRVPRLILGLEDPKEEACHHCDRPGCWNREHLFVGTQLTNMHDAMNKQRHKNTKPKEK